MTGDIGKATASPYKFPLTVEGRTVHVHGTAAQIEFTGSTRWDEVGYYGWGTQVTSYDETVWFHIPIPISVDWQQLLLSGKGTEDLSTVSEIGAEFFGDPWVHIRSVHLWDGSHRFAHWDQPDPQPKAIQTSGGLLKWDVMHHVQRSLGISVAVRYPINFDPPVTPSIVTLLSAYAVLL